MNPEDPERSLTFAEVMELSSAGQVAWGLGALKVKDHYPDGWVKNVEPKEKK